MSYTSFSLLLILLLTGIGCTATQTVKVESPASPAVVPLDSSEIFEVFSPTNNQHYRIRARLPASYFTDTSQRYPVIIKLDGQWDFLLAASAYSCLYFDGRMPETVIVGIDWGDVEGDVHAIRSRDLLPHPTNFYPASGQASTFVKIIADEILPELEKRYRLDGKRFLLGGSWSGVFATYALLENPAAFDGAIAIGPSYDAGGPVMRQQIEVASRSEAFRDKRLYIGIGKWDPVVQGAIDYANALTKAQVTGLQIKLDDLAGFGHSGMNIPGYAAGYQYMFKRPLLSLGADQLAVYAGVYKKKGSEEKIVVSAQGDDLIVQFTDGERFHLWAQSGSAFYHPGYFYNLSFVGDLASVETFYGKSQYERISR